jgi:TRAP-type mannitol/chloroaromatic compound transport system permease large subunit
VFILVLAFFRPDVAPKLSQEEIPESASKLLKLLARGFIAPTILILLVIGSIIMGWASPMEASGVGAFGAVILALLYGKWNFRFWRDCVESSALTNAMLFMIFIGSTIFAFVFRAVGGDDFVRAFFEGLGLGPWGILLFMMFVIFMLGFFFEWIEITFIVLPLFAPMVALLDFGTHVVQADVLMWFAILMAVNLQTSYLTPPFAITLFYMRGITPPSVRLQDMYLGVIPFVLLQMIGLGLVIVFPQIALWLPIAVFGR